MDFCGTQQWHLPQMAERVPFLEFTQWKCQGYRILKEKLFGYLKTKSGGEKKSESTSVTKTCSELFLMVTK